MRGGRLDIVIVNYETPGLLDDGLRSITARGASGVREVIVVDNSPTPEGAELIVRKHPAVVLLRSTTNIGYGSAANRGIAAGSGEYALVLNADAHLHAGAVETLIDELDMHPDAGVVGPRLVDAEGQIQPSCARFPTPAGCSCTRPVSGNSSVGRSSARRLDRLRTRAPPWCHGSWVRRWRYAADRSMPSVDSTRSTSLIRRSRPLSTARSSRSADEFTRQRPSATRRSKHDVESPAMQREMFRSLPATSATDETRDCCVFVSPVVATRVHGLGAMCSPARTESTRPFAQSAHAWWAIVGDA